MSGCFRNSIEEGRTSERPRTIMYKENLSACNLNTAGDRVLSARAARYDRSRNVAKPAFRDISYLVGSRHDDDAPNRRGRGGCTDCPRY